MTTRQNTLICVLLICVSLVNCAKKIPLEQPSPQTFKDETEKVTLAQHQSFNLPITTRTITHTIQTVPPNNNQCRFQFQSLLYRSLASSSLLIGEDQITDMLPLTKKQKIFLVDQNHNLLCYSLDEHFLLKRMAPKTSIVGSDKKMANIVLAATSDEEYVYYITASKYFVFKTESLGVEILVEDTLEGNLIDAQKVLIHKGYLVIFSRQSLLYIYKIDKSTKKLLLVQKFQSTADAYYADMQFDKTNELLYVLGLNNPQITVYHFEPSDFPEADKTFTVFKKYDSIQFQGITNKHHSTNDEKNVHFDLAISTKREEQTLMILFLHNYHNVVAELFYSSTDRTWKFIRYFKFSMRVNQIHIIQDVLVVVGSESMGVFPFGIHPRLIDEQLNGLMTLTSIFRLKVLENGQFVGITKSTIEYGVIKLEQKAELICKIQKQSKIESIKLRANLTACTDNDRLLYDRYCTYEKIFILQEMQLAVSAPMANTIWIAMLIFLIAIIIGLCILFTYFCYNEVCVEEKKEKKKNQPGPTSDRRAFNHL